ncbi:inositol monophosphatase [Streptomyces sp. B6B3]|uniref:inositol monophosphatase family protein n=1 Tax=Streptomyces sp. B6B3 TaxID=3153570 RepID=UPI00325D4276
MPYDTIRATHDTPAQAALNAGARDRVHHLVEVARGCCREAAALLRRRAAEGTTARDKTAHERVSDADLESERLLRDTLGAAVPGSAVIGEELPPAGPAAGSSRAPGTAVSPGEDVTWYVDPIDGTHNFLRGLPLACVSVGVAVGGRLVGGCVHDVFRDESFTGGEGVPLRVDGAAPPPAPAGGGLPLVFTDIPLTGRSGTAEPAFYLELIERADVRRLYSTALSLAWLAAGRADLACNVPIRPWDVAAGAALVRAAGGRYTPVGAPEPAAAPGFVATGPRPDGDGDRGLAELERWAVARLTALHRGPTDTGAGSVDVVR